MRYREFQTGEHPCTWLEKMVRIFFRNLQTFSNRYQIRREARLRREYIYKKSLEDKEIAKFEKKQKLKAAFDSKTPLPPELRSEDSKILRELAYDESQATPTTHQDDEYANTGVQDPKIVVTTSRDPSSRLSQFAKEMKLVFPNSQRLNRGNHVIKEIVDACKANAVTDLVILHEHRGVPDGLIISHFPYGPTACFSLYNVVLRHDIPDQGTVSEAFPHLIFEGFSTKLGERTKNILKHLFPVPKEDSTRVMTFQNTSDFISFRHHTYKKTSYKNVELTEVGPRFEMKLYEVRLGTVDIEDADKEWVYRPYLNTTKKRDFL